MQVSCQKNLGTEIDYLWKDLPDKIKQWHGKANQLSAEHAYWPQIEKVLPAIEKKHSILPHNTIEKNIQRHQFHYRKMQTAEQVIRQRRSTQRMLSGAGISEAEFYQILSRTLPTGNTLPFDTFSFQPTINFLLFVHHVEGVKPGLYAFIRSPDNFTSFKKACQNPDLQWRELKESQLPLYALSTPLDVQKTASKLSCYQAIAGHSAFSLGMLTNMDETLCNEGAWAYRRLFWEAGLIGQVLYLEAVATGISATGIGCYFDDSVHQLLGLEPEGAWQSLYHFTLGVAHEDHRLTSFSGYHHLEENV